ncbi:hypothetical protein VNO77_44280 [Canavalia gladiata]|uniref:Uncharacterized protein n=1 Tax=Canavalia gladiata TaxID=3824 RepID=A0AAN9PQL7_CANGL
MVDVGKDKLRGHPEKSLAPSVVLNSLSLTSKLNATRDRQQTIPTSDLWIAILDGTLKGFIHCRKGSTFPLAYGVRTSSHVVAVTNLPSFKPTNSCTSTRVKPFHPSIQVRFYLWLITSLDEATIDGYVRT